MIRVTLQDMFNELSTYPRNYAASVSLKLLRINLNAMALEIATTAYGQRLWWVWNP